MALQLRTYKKFLNIRTADLIVPWLTAVASALFIFGIGRELVGLVGNPGIVSMLIAIFTNFLVLWTAFWTWTLTDFERELS